MHEVGHINHPSTLFPITSRYIGIGNQPPKTVIMAGIRIRALVLYLQSY